jgi:uncharacterized membrane protein YsdA (DUF1294 family)
MMLFRHKTKHTRFMVLVPLWMVLWAVGLVLLRGTSELSQNLPH